MTQVAHEIFVCSPEGSVKSITLLDGANNHDRTSSPAHN
jgi:hypothetical protein